MKSLKWEDVPENSSSKPASESNIWFAATIGLLGVIVGYILPQFIH